MWTRCLEFRRRWLKVWRRKESREGAPMTFHSAMGDRAPLSYLDPNRAVLVRCGDGADQTPLIHIVVREEDSEGKERIPSREGRESEAF